MTLGIFKKELLPLTAACMKLGTPEDLVEVAYTTVIKKPSTFDGRAAVLSLVIMGAAGDFIGGLKWDEHAQWQGSKRYLSHTNLDVITAEAIVWIGFLLGKLWRADAKNDREIFERIGYVTTKNAHDLALGLVKDLTGFNFTERAIESRRLYIAAAKDNQLYEAFASVIVRAVGCKTLAEPLNAIGPLPPAEWTPLSAYTGIFFSTMPSGFYETYKNILRQWPDKFPYDDENFDD